MQRAQVVKLDRGYPLVRCEDGRLVRCEHATALVKGEKVRAVIGDFVEVNAPEGHDKGIIESICPRERAFVRKDPTERAVPQVLAANFDRVILAQPLAEVNLRRLERELVLAYETGAAVTVVLTKADLAESEEQVEQVADRVRALAGPDVRTLVVSDGNAESVEAVRALMAPGTTTVLVGKSGVGKSSLKRCRKRARCARVTARAATPRSAARWWPSPAAGTWWTCPACAAWGYGMPTRASARRSPTSSRRRSSAASATASMRMNRVAPCAPPSNPAR